MTNLAPYRFSAGDWAYLYAIAIALLVLIGAR